MVEVHWKEKGLGAADHGEAVDDRCGARQVPELTFVPGRGHRLGDRETRHPRSDSSSCPSSGARRERSSVAEPEVPQDLVREPVDVLVGHVPEVGHE